MSHVFDLLFRNEPGKPSRCRWMPVVVGLLCLTVSAEQGMAFPKFRNLVMEKYKLDAKISGCGLCHLTPTGNSPRNAFGAAFEAKGKDAKALAAIEKLDSDKDGVDNLTELRTGHFPGDPKDKPTPAEIQALSGKAPAKKPSGTKPTPKATPTPQPKPKPKPTDKPAEKPKPAPAARQPVDLSETGIWKVGKLPGVTWTDDVFPVFQRNGCISCHSGPRPQTVPGKEAFALNLDTPGLAFQELVYNSSRYVRPGETLRNGQSAWPLGARPEEQRRISPGDPEASTLWHKLKWDYVGARPGTSVEAGQKLRYGAPMPPKAPKPIPDDDLKIIEYWIRNSAKLLVSRTVLELTVTTPDHQPVVAAATTWIGDWNGQTLNQVFGTNTFYTDANGKVRLELPQGIVASTTWYVIVRSGKQTTRVTLGPLTPGKTVTQQAVLPAP